jgi:hypothetical protein
MGQSKCRNMLSIYMTFLTFWAARNIAIPSQSFWQQVRRSPALSIGFLCLTGAIVGLGGCSTLDRQVFKPEMSMQVEASGASGQFTLKGRTNLPQPEVEKRQQPIVITIQAVRQLIPKAGAKKLTNLKPVNAIVARQRIETLDGNWEAKLNLLQPSDKGMPLEVWQMNPAQFPEDLEPSPMVTFLAATGSIDRTLEFSPDVTKTSADGQKPVLQSATDGSLFLQAEESRNIAPPALPKVASKTKTSVVKVTAQSISGKVPEQKNRLPLSSQEFMR